MIDTIQIFDNLLSKEELYFLDSACAHFAEKNVDVAYNDYNYYIRKKLNIKKDLLEYQKKCKELIQDEYDLFSLWINKVTIETNANDSYHNDISDLTIVTYINDTFDGGEFEYFENENLFKIKPIRNMSLIMDDKLKHRVLKITKNERFSLISFYYKNKKKEKTII
jgi:hypothetical protein